MKAWGNLPSSLRRENTENAVATRVHPWDVKNKTGSRVQTIPRDIPSSTDVPVLLLNHSIVVIRTARTCSLERAARAARLFFHTRPIKFLVYGVVVAVLVVDAKTP